MTKIETINLHDFSNNEHFWLMSDFDQLVASHPACVWGMEVLYDIFKNTLLAEDLALRVEQGSHVSQTLERLDQQRDQLWNAINMRVQATLLSPLEEEAQSAQVIEQILEFYGDVCSMTNTDQSLAVNNLTHELLLSENEVHIDRIGFPTWVIGLKNCNEEFLEVYNRRNSEFAGRESGDVKTVRTLLDPVYHQLVEKMNATLVLEFAQPETIIFVKKFNEKIHHYLSTSVKRNSLSHVEERKIKEV